jgi:HTH-type transcriptional regulator/antitoxin HigA
MSTALDLTAIRALRTDGEYEAALAEIEALMDRSPARLSEEGARLEALSLLVEHYERQHYPIEDAGTPQDIVDFMLEQHGMTRSDLNDLLGGKSRVSEFFSGKRALSIGQIKALYQTLHIPADLLLNVDPSAEGDQAPGARKLKRRTPSRRRAGSMIAGDDLVIDLANKPRRRPTKRGSVKETSHTGSFAGVEIIRPAAKQAGGVTRSKAETSRSIERRSRPATDRPHGGTQTTRGGSAGGRSRSRPSGVSKPRGRG